MFYQNYLYNWLGVRSTPPPCFKPNIETSAKLFVHERVKCSSMFTSNISRNHIWSITSVK